MITMNDRAISESVSATSGSCKKSANKSRRDFLKKLGLGLAGLAIGNVVGGCATRISKVDIKLSKEIVERMNELYKPVGERAFCVSIKNNSVPFLAEGGLFLTDFPICDKECIIFHTHPFYNMGFPPSIWDEFVWRKYQEKYGNQYFGVMEGKGYYTIYELDE